MRGVSPSTLPTDPTRRGSRSGASGALRAYGNGVARQISHAYRSLLISRLGRDNNSPGSDTGSNSSLNAEYVVIRNGDNVSHSISGRMSRRSAVTHSDAGTLELMADGAPMNAQLGTDLAQGPTLGVQVGCTLNVHGATVTAQRPGG